MDNIEIKRTPNKKSMESLLDQSAIDNQFNYEAQQIRQAYNKTIKDLNQKIKQQEKQIQLLQLQIKRKNKDITQYQTQLSQKQQQISGIISQNTQLGRTNTNLQKRLSQIQYKLETIQNNRKIVPQYDYDDQQRIQNKKIMEIRYNSKKQVYKQVTEILNIKINKFLKNIKSYPMSIQLQQCIESFLQQIIYLNSNENKQIFYEKQQQQKQRQVGKISERRGNMQSEKFSQMQQWKQMQKSLNKLKAADNRGSPVGRKIQSRRKTQKRYNYEQMISKPEINYI